MKCAELIRSATSELCELPVVRVPVILALAAWWFLVLGPLEAFREFEREEWE